jgi:hypothetical protein
MAGIGDATRALPDGTIGRLGAKLRCGGVEPGAFPSPARVAQVIATCREHALPLKCTAGLHHPLRHTAVDVGAMSHGFLNVFGAGILAYAHDLTRERIESCIADERAASFIFESDSFAWRDLSADAATVERARRDLMTGFGSCSFDEPRADLQDLGLLSDDAALREELNREA